MSRRHIEKSVLSRAGVGISNSETVAPKARDFISWQWRNRYVLGGAVDGHIEDFGCLEHFICGSKSFNAFKGEST